MVWQRIFYITLIVVAASIPTASAVYIRHRHRTQAAKTIMLILLCGTFGLVSYALRLLSENPESRIFYYKLVYLPLTVAPVLFFVFALQYTGREKWATRRNIAVLSIVPLAALILVFTNRYHGFMWTSIEPTTQSELFLLDVTFGPWYWIPTIYSHILVLSSDFLLIQLFIRARRFYRRQITSMLLAAVLIQLWGTLPPLKVPLLLYVSITVLLFSAACPLLALSIFRFRVADIVPVARSAVIDSMSDGVMVLDPHNRILDVNPLVQQLISRPPSDVIGQPVGDVWPAWLDQIEQKNGTDKEITLNLYDGQHIYDVRASPLTDWRGSLVSQIVVLRDITDRKKTEMQLKSIFEASKLINSTIDINKILTFISDSCQNLVGFDNFTIFLVSKDTNRIYPAYSSGKSDDVTEMKVLDCGEGLVSHCIKTREHLLLENTSMNRNIQEITDFNELLMSQIVVPLIIEDECVGALHISKDAGNAYDHDDMEILKPLSEVISSAIRNSSLYNEIKEVGEELEKRINQRSRRVEILLNARQELQKETSWKRGLNTIVESMETLGFDRVGLFLVNFMKKTLDFHIGRGVNLTGGTSILLDNKEYFGVRCVLEKKTIHVRDSNLARGKQIVSSNSFVWVPIVVQDEAFAALAAGNLGSKSVTNEDVKDLEILAGMCGAFIDRTRILIEPVTERKSTSEIKHQLGPMESYIILGKKPEKAFRIFFDLVTHSIAGFVISREYPEKIKKKYKLQKTPMLWLSRSEGKNTISPDDLPKLSFIIGDFTRKSTESVILLDGLEYLVTQLGFEAVLKYLHELRDTIVLNNSRLVIPVNKEILSLREFNMLDREFTMLESDAYLFSFLD